MIMQKSWRTQNIEASRRIGEGRAELPKEGDLVEGNKAAPNLARLALPDPQTWDFTARADRAP